MIELKNYTQDYREEWNDFLIKSRIDTFLFNRDFMDYHSDKFKDNSYLIFRKGKLEALIPGNISNNIFYSHQGLTYGGLISSSKFQMNDFMKSFKLINEALKNIGVNTVVYKSMPFIYQQLPSQEDIYVLFTLNAEKIACNISSCIYQNNKLKFSESRKSGIRKAISNKLTFHLSNEFDIFWKLLSENLLLSYGVLPVHNILEITNLHMKFPDNIKLYVVKHESQIIGGSVLFIMKNVVHVQYISANETGKELGALDFLFDRLINIELCHIPMFDFGQSTENLGEYLNENLIFQKEGFGGRGVTYETYKYKI